MHDMHMEKHTHLKCTAQRIFTNQTLHVSVRRPGTERGWFPEAQGPSWLRSPPWGRAPHFPPALSPREGHTACPFGCLDAVFSSVFVKEDDYVREVRVSYLDRGNHYPTCASELHMVHLK